VEEIIDAIPPLVKNAPFSQELYGEFKGVRLDTPRSDDGDNIYYLDSRKAPDGKTAREDQYIVKLTDDGPVTVSPCIGGVDYILDEGVYTSGTVITISSDGKTFLTLTESDYLYIAHGKFIYRPADTQERMVIDYLFIDDGRWLVVNLAKTAADYTLTYSLYDRDFNIIASDLPLSGAETLTYRDYDDFSSVMKLLQRDRLFSQSIAFNTETFVVSLPDYAFIRCWYQGGDLYLITYKDGFSYITIVPVGIKTDNKDFTFSGFVESSDNRIDVRTLYMTGEKTMHLIREFYGGRRNGNHLQFFLWDMLTDELTGSGSSSTNLFPLFINRQLAYSAMDDQVYCLTGKNQINRMRDTAPGYNIALEFGRQTLFSFDDDVFKNLILFSDHTGHLYMSAYDSYEWKTVIYKLTRK
jgi:hypothetical protein